MFITKIHTYIHQIGER